MRRVVISGQYQLKLNMKATTATSQIQSLIDTGRTMLDMPVTGRIERMMKHFLRLIQEEETFRKKWLLDRLGNNDPDDGLIEKNGKGLDDRKFFFHYRPDVELLLAHNNADTSGYEEFFLDLSMVYHACAPAAIDLFKALDLAMPGHHLLDKHMALPENERNVLRLLYYKPGNKILAKAHTDRNFGTFHLHESHPGLYLGNDEQYFQVERDKTLFFFGEKAGIETGGLLKPSMHYVEATTSDWRWSVVFFIHTECSLSQKEIEEIVEKKKTGFSYPDHGNRTHSCT